MYGIMNEMDLLLPSGEDATRREGHQSWPHIRDHRSHFDEFRLEKQQHFGIALGDPQERDIEGRIRDLEINGH